MEQEVNSLRAFNNKKEVELQKAMDRTNKYALKMDQTKDELNKYEKSESGQTEQNQIIKEQQNKITELNATVDTLQHELDSNKSELSNYVLHIDKLNDQVSQAQSQLENSENLNREEKKQLKDQVQHNEKEIKMYKKAVSKLRKELASKGKEVALSYIKLDELTEELKKSTKQNEVDKKSYFIRLQQERDEINTLTDLSTEIVNNILDQQEKDQKISWWKKIQISVSPQVFLPSRKSGDDLVEEQVPEKEKEYYFFPGYSNELPTLQKVKEKFKPKTKQWEVVDVEPKIDQTISSGRKALQKVRKYGRF